MVVEVVGASTWGQASGASGVSRQTSAAEPSVEGIRPTIAITGTMLRRANSTMSPSSLVSPELLSPISASFSVIMPRSPWLASPGWTK